MSVHEVLEDAADYIEANGWIQGDLYNDEGAACAVGAIQFVARHPTQEFSAYSWLGRTAGCVRMSLPTWNDQPDRTKQEVLDTFRRAAKHARLAEERREQQ